MLFWILFAAYVLWKVLVEFSEMKKRKEQARKDAKEIAEAERYASVRNRIIEEQGLAGPDGNLEFFGPEDYEWLDKAVVAKLNSGSLR